VCLIFPSDKKERFTNTNHPQWHTVGVHRKREKDGLKSNSEREIFRTVLGIGRYCQILMLLLRVDLLTISRLARQSEALVWFEWSVFYFFEYVTLFYYLVPV
jgi:hypothetical protein